MPGISPIRAPGLIEPLADDFNRIDKPTYDAEVTAPVGELLDRFEPPPATDDDDRAANLSQYRKLFEALDDRFAINLDRDERVEKLAARNLQADLIGTVAAFQSATAFTNQNEVDAAVSGQLQPFQASETPADITARVERLFQLIVSTLRSQPGLIRAMFRPMTIDQMLKQFRQKALLTSDEFDLLLSQHKKLAFRVWQVNDIAAIQRMRQSLRSSIELQKPFRQFWNEQRAALRDAGERGRPWWHAQAVYRQQVGSANRLARNRVMKSNVGRALFPWQMYETRDDRRVRPEHAALDGRVVATNDPWWNSHDPPWDWGCRCVRTPVTRERLRRLGVTPVSGPTLEQLAPTKSPFDQDLTEIRLDKSEQALQDELRQRTNVA